MGQKYLIDSNVLIDYASRQMLPECLDFVEQILEQQFIVSVIVKIEILGFNDIPQNMVMMESFVALAQTIYIDEKIAQRTVNLRRWYKKLKLGDAIIAATALESNLTLLTRNVDDFKNIAGLAIKNPHIL